MSTRGKDDGIIRRMVKNIEVPALGFGTFELTGADGRGAIECALETGYRHVDTAIRYGNEVEVGQAIAASGLLRSEIFLTSKIWHTELTPDALRRQASESLERLGTDYLDLLLIHWPNAEIDLRQSLDAMSDLRERKLVHSIGVANFPTALTRQAVETCGADLLTNQVEYHPLLDQGPVMSACRRYGMLLTAYLPLARGAVTTIPELETIGSSHGKTAAQVGLRWLIQQPEVVAIPRSARAERIRENFDIFDFELDADEMARIDALRGGRRFVDVPWAPVWDAAGETGGT